MAKNIKRIGNKCELELCKLLSEHNFWCHLLSYNKNGQPCDVVAMKGNLNYLIDVKHIEGTRFDFSRIEPNQHTCFDYAMWNCDIENCGFAIYSEVTCRFYWMNYDVYNHRGEYNSIDVRNLELFENEINSKK